MNRKIFAVVLTASVALMAGSKDRRPWSEINEPNRSPAVVEALDRCIQVRFQDDIKDFGIARMVAAPIHLRGFQPETSDEEAATSQLRQDGVRMAFYLGSRLGLDLEGENPPKPENDVFDLHPPVSQAVFITDPKALADIPKPYDLGPDARKALAAFETSDFYSSKLGSWTIEARPLRATRASCLQCHKVEMKLIPPQKSKPGDPKSCGPTAKFTEKPLKIGDTLGIAFYVFAKTR